MGHALATLVGAGHRLSDILHRRQPGFPYDGWSKPQVELFLWEAIKDRERQQADFIGGVHLGAAALLGKEGAAAYRKAMKQLGGDDA